MRDTPVVFGLLILCALVFLAETSGGAHLIGLFALWPPGLGAATAAGGSQFHPWQIVTYAFLHGSTLHLVLNLYALWLFGVPLERRWGPQRFAVYFFSCVIGAAVLHLVVADLMLANDAVAGPVVGASGGVFGLLLAFGMLYPDVQLMLLIPPIPIRARWFVIGYGVIELAAGITGSAAGIAHFAHLGGMLTGFLLLRGARW